MKKLLSNKGLVLPILALAIPAIIEMALNTLVGVIDTIMVSQFIGLDALSAAGFANQLIMTIIFIFSSFNAGATAMIARSYGEKNIKKLNQILGQNIWLNTLIGFALMVSSYLFAPLLFRIFDVSDTVFSMGVSYLRIVSLGTVFMFISNAAKASLRGASDTRTPMYITLFINVLNVVGNYVLITGYSIFPKMGINGAALATTLARLVEVLIFVYVLLKGRNGVQLHLPKLKLTSEIAKPLWRLSSSAAVEQAMMQIAFLVSGIILSKLDTVSEGAFRILLNIESLSFMPAVGISIATASLVGKALGERDPEKALHTGYTSSLLGAIWGLSVGILFFIFPEFFLHFFTSDSVLLAASTPTMYAMGVNQVFLAFWIVMTGALRGTGDTRGVMVIAGFRLWLLFTPLCYLFMLTMGFGVIGLWYAEILSLALFNYVVYRRFAQMKWAAIAI